MKVMIQAPWDEKPHGPYEVDESMFTRKIEINSHYSVGEKWMFGRTVVHVEERP
jgi:hypothetical protein